MKQEQLRGIQYSRQACRSLCLHLKSAGSYTLSVSNHKDHRDSTREGLTPSGASALPCWNSTLMISWTPLWTNKGLLMLASPQNTTSCSQWHAPPTAHIWFSSWFHVQTYSTCTKISLKVYRYGGPKKKHIAINVTGFLAVSAFCDWNNTVEPLWNSAPWNNVIGWLKWSYCFRKLYVIKKQTWEIIIICQTW